MKLEFDKELDALLRKATQSGEFISSAEFESHLDADEISIFAENALPENARPRVVKHLADCERCRISLSNIIELNSEAETVTASSAVSANAIETVSTQIPWYKKLFSVPKLTYALGALMLLFTGVFGFLAVQNLFNSNSEVAQVNQGRSSDSNVAVKEDSSDFKTEDKKVDSDDANISPTDSKDETSTQDEKTAPESSPSGKDLTDNSPNVSKPETTDELEQEKKPNDSPESDKNIKTEKKDAPSKVADEGYSDDASTLSKDTRKKRRTENEVAEEAKERLPQPAPPPVKRSTPKPAKPKKKIASRMGKGTKSVGRVGNMTNPRSDTDSAKNKSATQRRISGKVFNLRNRVWYDSAYRNQKTTNIRRGTSNYKKLDSGLRSIASKLNGTVVVVWKSKAYRIQ